MKNQIAFITLLSVAGVLSSCHGVVDDDPAGGSTVQKPGVLTLYVDKTQIEADGKDVATFSLISADGKELTADDEIGNVYFQNVATEERLERRTRTFSSFENGEYTFAATYKGEKCANTVTIKAVNREKYETFHKNIAIYKLTGTWCYFCPQMTNALNGIKSDIAEHIIELAFHASSVSQTDPFAINMGTMDCGNYLLARFGGTGFPNCVYNMNFLNDARTSEGIAAIVQKERAEHPATSGIKVVSTYSSGKADISATLKSDKGGEYDLGCAILADGCHYSGGSAKGGIYNNVVVACSPNFASYSNDTAKNVTAGGEAVYSFSLNISEPASGVTYSIVVFSIVKDGKGSRIDNIVECPLGENLDYIYN